MTDVKQPEGGTVQQAVERVAAALAAPPSTAATPEGK